MAGAGSVKETTEGMGRGRRQVGTKRRGKE